MNLQHSVIIKFKWYNGIRNLSGSNQVCSLSHGISSNYWFCYIITIVEKQSEWCAAENWSEKNVPWSCLLQLPAQHNIGRSKFVLQLKMCCYQWCAFLLVSRPVLGDGLNLTLSSLVLLLLSLSLASTVSPIRTCFHIFVILSLHVNWRNSYITFKTYKKVGLIIYALLLFLFCLSVHWQCCLSNSTLNRNGVWLVKLTGTIRGQLRNCSPFCPLSPTPHFLLSLIHLLSSLPTPSGCKALLNHPAAGQGECCITSVN